MRTDVSMSGWGVRLKGAIAVALVLLWELLSPAAWREAPPRDPSSCETTVESILTRGEVEGPDARLEISYDRLPMIFEANRGQADGAVDFLSRGSGYALWLTRAEAVLALKRNRRSAQSASETGPRDVDILRLKLLGASETARLVGVDRPNTTSHYLIGNEPARWVKNLPTHSRVRCENVYPGIDLIYHGAGRELEYDFIVGPRVDPNIIALAIAGADRISVDGNGDLVLSTAGGEVRHHKPVVYQEVQGERRRVEGNYVLKADNVVGFEVGAYDPRLSLVIDPVLSYSTYLGAGSADEIRGVAVDSSGSVYVTGNTISANFYAISAAQATYNGPNSIEDAFVAKLNPEGTALVYSTYLGGHGSDLGLAVAVDALGYAYVTGQTSSSDFPTTAGAFQTSSNGGIEAFIARLTPAGNALSYSTYLSGRSGNQRANAIAVDSSRSAYITGKTLAADFPTTPGALQRQLRGDEDAFVAKLSPSGSSLLYSTYLGGDGNTDEGLGIAVDASGFAYIAGHTGSTNFPTTIDAVQRQFGGGDAFLGDGFVSKLDQSGSSLVYSTYLGGGEGEVAAAVSVDSEGYACVTGTTRSSNFPIAHAIQPAKASACVDNFSNCTDAFVTKLSPSGGQLIFSTYLGGGSRGSSPFQAGDSGAAIAVDGGGNTFVTGTTSSTDFPLARALQASNAGNGDSFIAALSPAGEMLYSTYLGGPGDESASSIAASRDGDAFVAGIATSTGFPSTPGAFQTGFNGSFQSFALARDGFVARLSSIIPRILSVEISGKHLIVSGERFDDRAVLLLNGEDQKTRRDTPDPSNQLRGKKTGKRIPVGQTVTLRVRNGDGAQSAAFAFTRAE